MGCDVFLFGTLRHEALRSAVLGRGIAARDAVLADHMVDDQRGLPCLLHARGAQARGMLIRLDDAKLARLDFYESIFDYSRDRVTVECDGKAVAAQLYRPVGNLDTQKTQPWDYAQWVATQAAAATAAAHDVFALAPHYDAQSLRMRYPMLLAYWASRLRATATAQPATVRRGWTRADVVSRQRMLPYAYFFGVQVDDLQFRRFDDSLSPVVRRAGFVMSDAVTLLPYDPARDCVLIIEQFRYGPYLRGDDNCWSLEPIAGRIDPGETPEAAALREAQEEARLLLSPDKLLLTGRSYPSPGAISEFLFNYVALCNLSEYSAGVAGVATEAEDIRSHVITFDRLMELIRTGEAQNGPLIQTAYWLALNRAELRSA